MTPASDSQISQAFLPSRAGALFSCRLSSFWQSAGLQNHRPLVRIHPHENPNFLQTENHQRISTLAVFYGRGWIAQAAHLKKPRRGFFLRRTIRRVDAVRIHPPSLREGYYKTETPVPGSDTGVLGGREWTTQAALLKTAHWAVFALSSATAPQLFESTLAVLCRSSNKTETPASSQRWSSWWARVDSNHRS